MKELLIGSSRIYCSILAFASKAVTLVYLPLEIADTWGRVLNIMYCTPISMAASTMVLPLRYSTSTALELKSGVVMMNTVWTLVSAVRSELRSVASPWTMETFSLSL